jgi:hypothetical protein
VNIGRVWLTGVNCEWDTGFVGGCPVVGEVVVSRAASAVSVCNLENSWFAAPENERLD